MEENKDRTDTIESGDDSQKHGRKIWVQITFLILLFLAIACMVAAIITVHRYADMLSNPLGYNLAKFGIDSCSYFNGNGDLVVINAINGTG